MEYFKDYKVKVKFNNKEIRIFDVEEVFPKITNKWAKLHFKEYHDISIGCYDTDYHIAEKYTDECFYRRSIMAENQNDMPTLIRARVLKNKTIKLKFDNGEKRIFDLQYHIDKNNLEEFKKIENLKENYIEYRTGDLVLESWNISPNKRIISSKYLYENSELVVNI